MTKRMGGFLVPDGMELPKDESDDEKILETEEDSEDSNLEEQQTEEEQESTETEEDVVSDEENTEEEDTESEPKPVAVLTVYGKQIPIGTMDELVQYAQRGVDYAQKLHLLKEWRGVIEAVSYNPQLKTLVDKVIKGEDISGYIRDPKAKSDFSEDENEDEIQNVGDTAISEIREALEDITDKKIQKTLSPYLAQLRERELKDYLKSLEQQNPKHHKTIAQLILMALQDPSVPEAIKEAIKTDRNFFENMYNQIRERLEQMDSSKNNQESPETETPKRVILEKKRSVSKIPKLEDGKGSQDISIRDKVMEDAEKIWGMSPEEFKLFENKAKKR